MSFEANWSASAPRNRMPCSAPFPIPTMTAVGAARPMAQGQAMSRTAMKLERANRKAGAGPKTSQTPKLRIATPMTIGTKTAAIRSATFWIGGLEACAASTSWMIWARTVSRPTFVASKTNRPVLLIVAPKTSAPMRFSTGSDSPVSIDSSTAEAPSRMTPSTGIFSPGRTTTRSPTSTASTGMSTSRPSRTTRAVFARRPMSVRIASEVRPLARASRKRPRMMRVWRIATVSK